MSEKLYINDEQIDLYPSSISNTYQINDIGEVKDRQANYSNRIKIPKTENNVRALDFLGMNYSVSRVQYQRVNVKYYQNGIEIISDGYGVINGSGKDFELVIFDGNISMKEILGEDTISELDFTNYNHKLNATTMLSGFTNTSGYAYGINKAEPSIDSTNLNVYELVPMFYQHTLFENIFQEKGWSITGDIFSDSDWLNKKVMVNEGYERVYEEGTSGGEQILKFDYRQKLEVDLTANNSQFGETLYTYTANAEGSYLLEVTGSLYVTVGSVFGRISSDNGSSYTSPELTSNFNFSTTFNLNVGDKVFIGWEGNGVLISGNSSFEDEYRIAFDSDNQDVVLEGTYTNNLNAGYDIDFSELFGNMSQINFVKDCMQRYNLAFRRVRGENTFEFISFESLIQDFDNAIDWSDKYIAKISEIYRSGYAQKNWFRAKYEEDDYDFDDYYISVDDVNLVEEKTLLTSIFKSPLQVYDRVYRLSYWTEENEPKEDGIKIFETFKEEREYPFVVVEGDVPVLREEEYECLTRQNLSYQNILNTYYTNFTELLDDYKKETFYFDLSVIDVYQLDFFKLIYLKQTQSYYYLNRVISYKKNQKTKVELIKIPT